MATLQFGTDDCVCCLRNQLINSRLLELRWPSVHEHEYDIGTLLQLGIMNTIAHTNV